MTPVVASPTSARTFSTRPYSTWLIRSQLWQWIWEVVASARGSVPDQMCTHTPCSSVRSSGRQRKPSG
ncbi:hypothetical protein ABZV14_18355 [Streptosporangium canum]|uniref:hypothetical protein n=1 Tax=Streptosporangium canum TaxID=324952 RepID=UPI0033ABC956